jgi:hypothetical protein
MEVGHIKVQNHHLQMLQYLLTRRFTDQTRGFHLIKEISNHPLDLRIFTYTVNI